MKAKFRRIIRRIRLISIQLMCQRCNRWWMRLVLENRRIVLLIRMISRLVMYIIINRGRIGREHKISFGFGLMMLFVVLLLVFRGRRWIIRGVERNSMIIDLVGLESYNFSVRL